MRLEDLTVDTVSLVDRAAVRDPANKTEPQRFLVWKRDDGSDERSIMSDEDLRAALDKAEREKKDAEERHSQELETLKAEHAKELEKAQGESEDKDDDDGKTDDGKPLVKKADLSPEVRAELAKAEEAAAKAEQAANERIEKAEKDAKEAQDIAKAERDRRVEAEFVVKAEALNGLSSAPSELGPVLKRASEALEKADFEFLEGLLTASSEQINRSELYKEFGSSGPAPASDASSELQRKADDLKKADPNLTGPEAMVAAMNSDTDLQKRYLAEQR